MRYYSEYPEKIVLEKLKLVSETIISKYNLFNTEAIFADREIDHIIFKLTQWIPSRELDKVVHKYPKDWIQAVKERFFPNFLLKRWPVEYTEIKLVAKELYPKISLPDENPNLVLMKYKNGFEEIPE